MTVKWPQWWESKLKSSKNYKGETKDHSNTCVSDRSAPVYARGELALLKEASGNLKCIGCKICEVACPSEAIVIRASRGESLTEILDFDIDMGKCILCGICQDICPVGAIVHIPQYESFYTSRAQMIHSKERLIKNGDKYHQASWVKDLQTHIDAQNNPNAYVAGNNEELTKD